MAHHRRIVVGVDDSASAQCALGWALRQAHWLRATVLVVTAWQEESLRPETERDRYRRLIDMQQRCIAEARATIDAAERPVIGRVLVHADPVTALRKAARKADLLVIGCSDTPLPSSVGAGLLASATPLVLISAPQLVVAPSERAVAAAV